MGIEKYWSAKQPAGRYDYIIIGAGMGGITCAATLAKMGKRVLLLEQHYIPGGYIQTFKRKTWSWDVGLHMVGELTEDDEFGRLLAYLTDDRLKWSSIGDPYDRYHFPDGFTFEYPASPEGYTHALYDAFPKQHTAIDKWIKLSLEGYNALIPYIKTKALPKGLGRLAQAVVARSIHKNVLRRQTLDVLDDLTDDPRLRAVLTAQWFYWGTPPSRSSFAINAIATSHLSKRGGFYPIGGAPKIVTELLRTVTMAGGWTRINADVSEILVSKGRAIGVRVKGRQGQPDEEILADKIVSGAGVYATVTRLLPEEYSRQTWTQNIRSLEPNMSYACLFLGYEGDIREAGASPMNRGFYDTWDVEKEWDITGPDNVGRSPFLWACFNSLKDPEYDPGPQNRYTSEVMSFVPWRIFKPWAGTRWMKRPAEYERLKQGIKDVLLKQFLEHMPQLEPMIVHSELSTPLSADHFVRAVNGSAYGLHHTVDRFTSDELRPRTPIKNLYFAGNELVILGVLGAAMGGFLAALSAEPRRGLSIARIIA